MRPRLPREEERAILLARIPRKRARHESTARDEARLFQITTESLRATVRARRRKNHVR